FFLYSGLHAVIYHRIAKWFYVRKMFFIARMISQNAKFLTGVEIHPGATIGKGLLIDHGSGVVIGETAVIGDNCTIYQGVTLGGTGKDSGKRHPTLGNNVMIGSGAKVLGPFTVGDNAKVAAGAVVLKEVPEGATAVGVPARIIFPKAKSPCGQSDTQSPADDPGGKAVDLDQIHIPDPVAQELIRLQCQITVLKQRLDESQNNTQS
ncbi:MAG: serine O-acetyltransferase, partial [Clostridia bacterium]|nr:serine O-acetyltransferase [Clostridia bacterium]